MSLFDFETFPVLETARLVLRELTHDDAPEVKQHLGDPDVTRFMDRLSMATLDDARAWIDWMASFFAEKSGLRWGVTLKTGGRLIGSAGMHNWDRAVRFAEVGYDFARPYWGQGYATEAARALIVFGFERMNLNRIEADLWKDNEASIRVLQKLGFTHEGTWRERAFKGGVYYDVLQFSLLRREWRPG